MNNIRAGRTVALVEFPHNYTDHLRSRILEKNYASKDDIDGTTISIRMDESSKHFHRKIK